MHNFLKICLNFTAVVLLIALLGLPFYFARNFSKVAGVKSESKYIIASQIEKFPNLKLEQFQDSYSVTYTKQGPNQAYLGVLVLHNPTNLTQNYRLEVSSEDAGVFFAENLENQPTQISVPSGSSVPISIHSTSSSSEGSIEFKIITN